MEIETPRILVVEHSFSAMELITETLEAYGFSVQAQPNASAALQSIEGSHFDLYIIDPQLPGGIDGYELCRRLRLITTTPILLVSSRDRAMDRVIGFELGADDYLSLPLNRQELVTRVRVLLRRGAGMPLNDIPAARRSISAGGITLDESAHMAQCENATIVLTPREFELLAFLMRNAGNVVSREDLLREAWGWEYLTSTKTVDTHIKRLRDKVRDAGVDPKVIETVRGYGYRFHA